jgi:hypothetical protein
MTAIWMEDDTGIWSLQPAASYDNEQSLHDIVMSTPELWPLSGSPHLTVLGREVALQSAGYADVLAVEPDGRPVIIEVKLRNNAESRRAVIAQTISYAASLHRISRQDFEEVVLARHLNGQSLFDRVRGSVQDEEMTQSDFESSLDAHLAAGSFRAVIVLDEAPTELINLVGYLESVTTGLSLDLIAVTSYRIGDRHIAVPQRLDPEHRPELALAPPTKRTSKGHLEPGVQAFRDLIPDTPEPFRETLAMMAQWVEDLIAAAPGVKADTYFTTWGATSLLPRLRRDNAGLVTLWRGAGGQPSASLWRTVFQRRAPEYIERVEHLTDHSMGQGTVVNNITPELLALFDDAYRAAVHTAS